MELKLNIIPEHNYKCIVVSSETMHAPVSDYETITCDNVKYNIVEWVTVLKSEYIPMSLLLLSIGTVMPKETIYKKYKKSDRLIFFICEKCEKI